MADYYDAIGNALINFQDGKESFEILERDDGFVYSSNGAARYFSPYDEWPSYEREAIAFSRGRCLDIGSGAGRVSLYLQSIGLSVTAIDSSPLAVEISRKRGVKDIRHVSIEEFLRHEGEQFDTVVALGYMFCMILGLEDRERQLNRLYRRMTDNACIIADCRDPYRSGDDALLEYCSRNRKRGVNAGIQRIRLRYLQFSTDWFNLLFASVDELGEIVSGAGFAVERCMKSERFERNGKYVAVIRKSSVTNPV